MRTTIAVLSCALLCLPACNGDDAERSRVEMLPGFRFQPKAMTVQVGETVTWVSDTADAHSVTAEEESLPGGADYFTSGGFSSEEEARANVADALITEGESFEWTFEVPGVYRYFCIPHESQGMTGTIVVEQ